MTMANLYPLLHAGTSSGRATLYQPTLTPANVAAGTTAEQTFAVAGLGANDVVVVNPPSSVAGIGLVGARASAAGVLSLTFANLTGAPLAPPAGVYRVVGVAL